MSRLAAELGLVPLILGGVLGHRRPVEPRLDIAARRSTDRWAKSRASTAIAARTFMARPLRWISAISAPSA